MKINNIKNNIYNFFLDSFSKEKIDSFIIFCLSFGGGIVYAIYANKMVFPFYFLSLAIFLICLSLFPKKGNLILLCLIFFTLGYIRFYYSEFNQNYKDIKISRIDNFEINGKVIDIVLKKDKNFIIVTNEDYKNYKLLINSDQKFPKIGDRVKCTIDLFGNKNRVNFFNRDINFYLNFNNTRLYGKIKEIESIEAGKYTLSEHMKNFRIKKIRELYENLKHERGYGIIIAILLGNSYFINDDDISNIRHIGIAHILAISGLHMATVLYALFYGLRKFFVSFFPSFSLRYNIKKISAIISCLFCYFYLILSGVSVSAERSFIMTAIFLFGVLFDKKSQSIRLLFTAFLFILIQNPANILHPSFQLSFIAVLALISVYSFYSDSPGFMQILNKKNSFFANFIKIMIAEFMTTFSTIFFEVYHFGQFVLLGTISNLLIIPLVEMLLMPVSFLSLLPGIGYYFSLLAVKIANFICIFSEKFVKIPYSYLSITKINEVYLFISVIGLLLLFLLKSRLRFFGLFILFILTFSRVFEKKPNIIILQSGKIILFKEEGDVFKSNIEVKGGLLRDIKLYTNQKELKLISDKIYKCKLLECSIPSVNFTIKKVEKSSNIEIILNQKKYNFNEYLLKNKTILINTYSSLLETK